MTWRDFMYSDYLDTDQVYREFGESCLSLCLRALLTNKIGGGGYYAFTILWLTITRRGHQNYSRCSRRIESRIIMQILLKSNFLLIDNQETELVVWLRNKSG